MPSQTYTENLGFKLNFNAGVLVLHPNHTTYENVLARMADARYPPGEAEQAFLNLYFGADVVRLPYVYNANLAIHDRTPALWDAMRDEMRIVHYTSPKPFPKDGKEIVDGARLDRSVEKARRQLGGLHAEEIDWWMDSYISTSETTKSDGSGPVRSLVVRERRRGRGGKERSVINASYITSTLMTRHNIENAYYYSLRIPGALLECRFHCIEEYKLLIIFLKIHGSVDWVRFKACAEACIRIHAPRLIDSAAQNELLRFPVSS